jgi:acetyl/propionyl-CoA carboxylase alpha subunit
MPASVEGDEVTPWYDPMLAKVIAHGRNRDDAIRRLIAALEDAPLLGVANNGRFLRDLLDHECFRSATMHTALLDDWAAGDEPILQRPQPTEADWQLAAAVLFAGTPGWRAQSVCDFDLTLGCGEEVRTTRMPPVEPGSARTALRRSNGASTPTAACATRRTVSPATQPCIATATRSIWRATRRSSSFAKPRPCRPGESRNDPAIARAPWPAPSRAWKSALATR